MMEQTESESGRNTPELHRSWNFGGGAETAVTVSKVEIAKWTHLCRRFPQDAIEVATGDDTQALRWRNAPAVQTRSFLLFLTNRE